MSVVHFIYEGYNQNVWNPKLIPSQFVTSSVMLCCLLGLRPLNLKQGSLLSYKQISNTRGSGAVHGESAIYRKHSNFKSCYL